MREMTPEAKMAVAIDYYVALERFLADGEISGLDDLTTPRAMGIGEDAEDLMNGLEALRAATEELHIEVEDMFTSGGRVYTLVRVTARQQGEYLPDGVDGVDGEMNVSEVHVLDIGDGKVKAVRVHSSEHWRSEADHPKSGDG